LPSKAGNTIDRKAVFRGEVNRHLGLGMGNEMFIAAEKTAGIKREVAG